MAAPSLIHHHYNHPSSAAASSSATRPKTLTLPRTTNLSLSSSKPLLLSNPSSSPPLHPLFTPNPLQNETPIPLSSHELFHLLKLSVQYSDTQLVKAVHASILKIQQDTRLFNSLITSYIQLGHLNFAQKVFNSILSPDVVSYSAMISGFAKSNCEDEALELFFEMIGSGIEPNEYTLVALLTACMRLLDVYLGSQVHAFAVKTGYCDSTYVLNALMGLYGKCGCSEFVFKLFDDMPNRDIASWNTVISCVVKEGIYDRAFELFRDMLRLEKDRVDYFTLSSLFVACASCFAMIEGRMFHAHALKIGYGNNLSVNNALIEFYSKCGSLTDVELLFKKMPAHDVFTWTEMINAYMGFGAVDMAVKILDGMPEKNCVSINALLSGYCKNGEGFRALKLFYRLLEEGAVLSDVTLTSILTACGLIMDQRTSEQIHAFVLKFGFGSNDRIETALLDMCTRCGRMDDAEKMFHRLTRDKNSSFMLTSMLCGYARNSEPDKALALICSWQNEEPKLMDDVASASILGLCGDLGFQNLGEQFHCHALKRGFFSEIGVGNATISMYFKCGDIKQASDVFKGMHTRDLVSWNGLLAGYILNRQGHNALDVWAKMQKVGVQPDRVTCLLIISAYQYTNSSLVDECYNFFLSMKSVYHIEPNSDHYSCLVDVLGCWGYLEEAKEIIEKMPFEPKASVWKALLNSSRIHMNEAIEKRAAKKILSIEPQDPSTYILQSNIYSSSGRWHCSELIRDEMRKKGIRKFPGRSWFIHQNKVHSFFARDKSHLQCKDIYSALEILFMECLRAGYEPDTSFVLHEVEEHQKINFLLYHSGKLAVVYGILMTSPGKTVRVIKNINLCGDCHTFFKYVSVVTKREIHVRDGSGFHCFANGECSCKDYW